MADLEDDDSSASSAMDVSSSAPSSPELRSRPAPHLSGSKRGPPGSLGNDEQAHHAQPDKRRKVVQAGPDQDQPRGPVELPEYIWQQVFSYLSPAMLCRFLRVSKTFNKYLTETKASPASQNGKSKKLLLDSETIWMQARKNFFPNMPRPLARCTELSMLQLVGGKLCQFCSRQPVPSLATTPFNSGPGPAGIRVIWPFGIRTCGRCLESVTKKDVEVLLASASTLRAGLPYAFLTPDHHFVPEIQRSAIGGIPASLHVAKIYLQKDIDDILSEYEDAQGFGFGAAEEWRKGLSAKGRAAMSDASRWEKWEALIRDGHDLSLVLREYDLTSFPRYSAEVKRRGTGADNTPSATLANVGKASLPPKPAPPSRAPHPQHASNLTSWQSGPHPHGFTQSWGPPPGFAMPSYVAKNFAEIEDIRRDRQAEIERRCSHIMPPLDARVLQAMECFQAAIQIARPFTDQDWEVLEPKILTERESAEWAEHLKANQLALLQAAMPAPAEKPRSKPSKESKEQAQQRYSKEQEPLRLRLEEFAEDYIKNSWGDSDDLRTDDYPLLCVQALMHVKTRYDEERKAGTLLPAVAQQSQLDGSNDELFLSLENMKWVFENKIKPHTDRRRQELFLCADCDASDGKPNWFAFDSLVQHFGAKHTDDFSKGNIVVHWHDAEWPDYPIFKTDPSPFLRRPQPKVNNRISSGPKQPRPKIVQPPQDYTPPMIVDQEVPIPEDNAQAELNTFESEVERLWPVFEGVKDMIESVRVQIVLHHADSIFLSAFRKRLPMDVVTEALATSEAVKPLKTAHGLACKICVAEQPDVDIRHESYYARISKVRLYNLSSLINHFKIVHQPSQSNWSASGQQDVKKMIELPENKLIGNVVHAQGMDDDKLSIVAAAFPTAFPYPLPRVGQVQQSFSVRKPDSESASRLLDRLDNKNSKNSKKKKRKASAAQQAGDSLAREDEYDPRRPSFASQERERGGDASRFDTDLARKSALSASYHAPENPYSMPSEKLSALEGLRGVSLVHSPPQPDDRSERSPSVGRVSAVAPVGNAPPSTAPDIAALLASLTGRAPAATSKPEQVHHPVHNSSYGQPSAPTPAYTPYNHDRPTSSHFTPAPAATPQGYSASTPNPGSDIEAALMRNTRPYEQPQYARPQQQSPAYPIYQEARPAPPEYRQVYSESRPPASSAPSYQPYQEVQYIQLPPDASAPHAYQPQFPGYGQPPPPRPRPVFIDANGRTVELIPIESVDPHYAARSESYGAHVPASTAAGSQPGAQQHVYYDYGDSREGGGGRHYAGGQ